MKSHLPVLLGIGWLLVSPLVVDAKIERTVEKTFTVQPGGTLKVETSGGGIKIVPGTDQAVKVTVKQRIDASTEAGADEILQHLALTLEQQGKDVTAIARYEGARASSWFHWGSWPPVQCEFIVAVPATYNVDLKTSGGGISVGDLAGKVVARTSGGGIQLGPVSGNAQIHTSGGGITIKGIDGMLSAHTSGGPIDVSFSGPLKDDCELSTSGGGITVRADPKSDFNLDARTSGGGVSCKLPITVVGEVKSSHLSGRVNAGGPELKLRTSGGSIRVVTQ